MRTDVPCMQLSAEVLGHNFSFNPRSLLDLSLNYAMVLVAGGLLLLVPY